MERARKKEAEQGLPAEEEKSLQVWLQRQKSLAESRKRCESQSAYLVAKTGHIERNTNRQTKLSQEEEEDLLLQKHWQRWDMVLWLAGCATPAELTDWVAKPEQFVENRELTALTFSDQIPVWLKPGAGKVLQSRAQQQSAHDRAKLRRAARGSSSQDRPALPAEQHEHSHIRGPGDGQSDRPPREG